MIRRLTMLISGLVLLTGCTKEPPPRSVSEFVENSMLLEAAMVRCSEDRTGTRYEEECINAREAVKRIAAAEEAARKSELEARSEALRKARRRAQEAAAEARRRAVDAERLRQEAEYLAQFGVTPSDADVQTDEVDTGNSPLVVIPPAQELAEVPPDANDASSESEGPDAQLVPPESDTVDN